uniref:Uncharacterized protein n=1 Tax=Leersia perrieri TaxID=77586 RepID=A0A0D9X720_9ORYZ
MAAEGSMAPFPTRIFSSDSSDDVAHCRPLSVASQSGTPLTGLPRRLHHATAAQEVSADQPPSALLHRHQTLRQTVSLDAALPPNPPQPCARSTIPSQVSLLSVPDVLWCTLDAMSLD